MIEITTYPHILAGLNTTTIALLLVGFYFIRSGDRARHKAAMSSALGVAVLFLIVYVYYHMNSGLAKFGGEGFIRKVYFTILIAHVLGAITLTPIVPFLAYRAFTGRFEAHKRLARWTLPLWLYVSISGVVVYTMAIHIYPFTG
jgi:putative membrane protein